MKFKGKLINIPNLLSLSRIFIIPFFYYYIKNYNFKVLLTLTIFLGISDFLDGFLARVLNQVSDVGKFLDPLCDKVAVFLLSILILIYTDFPLWAFSLMIFREMIVSMGGLTLLKREKIPITPNFWGKANVTVEFLIFAVYLFRIHFLKRDMLIALTTFLTISLLIYIKTFLDILRGRKKIEEIVREYSSYGFFKGNKKMNFFAISITLIFLIRLIYLIFTNLKI